MITLISAGHGVAVASATRLAACSHHNTVVRPLNAPHPVLLTYLLHHESLDSATAADFIERMRNQRWTEENVWEEDTEHWDEHHPMPVMQRPYRESARPQV